MKKNINLLFFIICLSCANEPQLYFPSSQILIEDVKIGSDKMITIPIINKGKKDLIIKNVNSSCKCIDIEFPDRKIKFNSEGYITMVFKADRLGVHKESIVIISNDPKVYKLIEINVNVVE